MADLNRGSMLCSYMTRYNINVMKGTHLQDKYGQTSLQMINLFQLHLCMIITMVKTKIQYI